VGETEAAWLAAGAQEQLLPVVGRDLQGKQHNSGNSVRIPWNKLSSPEETTVLATGRASPEWSSRQVVTWITDHLRLSLGESTVYRLLKREGLVKLPDMQLLAGKEYQRKTSGPNQMWATDASYLLLRISRWWTGAITTW
jgi:IS30 family transposase